MSYTIMRSVVEDDGNAREGMIGCGWTVEGLAGPGSVKLLVTSSHKRVATIEIDREGRLISLDNA